MRSNTQITPRNRGRIAAISLFLGWAVLAGCGRGVEWSASLAPSLTSCPTSTAEVLVGDGFIKRLCGCAEASDTLLVSGSPLICTVPVGTRVLFYYNTYSAIPTLHRIESVGTPSFPSSQITDPTSVPTHFVTFSSAGTYIFRDAFNHAIGGSFVVF